MHEIDRFQRQVDAIEPDIKEAVQRLESEAFGAEAQIMQTHLDMLRDPELHRQVLALIQASRHPAETAVEQILGSITAMIDYAQDPVLAERAADLRDLAMRSLAEEGVPFQQEFRQGVLIETPSAAWSFARLLEEVDFASVGTNDLVRYRPSEKDLGSRILETFFGTIVCERCRANYFSEKLCLFAVERNAANVADLCQPKHPVVLQVIRTLAEQAAEAGKPLSICGEMAADPTVLPVLAELGVTDISVVASAGTMLRRALASLGETGCRDLARQCVQADSLEDVRTLLGRDLQRRCQESDVERGRRAGFRLRHGGARSRHPLRAARRPRCASLLLAVPTESLRVRIASSCRDGIPERNGSNEPEGKASAARPPGSPRGIN